MLSLRSLWSPRSPRPPAREGSGDAQERELLAGVARGRRADFEALYRLYHPRLQRFLNPLLRQGELIDEALNDTLLVVWQRAADFDGRSKLSTWIFGIAYRKGLKALARRDLPQEAEPDQEPVCTEPGPEDRLSLAQSQRQLRAALAELSWEHRAVVELCYFQDMAYAEIAEVVGCPPETVKTRMFYARRRLRHLLDAAAGQGESS
jgi:RNA polymerase sigma-70 factor (ECF subfamily)